MLAFKATYKLSNDNGTTTYISQPFKSEEEAKKELFEQLERLEKDGELKNMTYCNVIDESIIANTHEREKIKATKELNVPPKKDEKELSHLKSSLYGTLNFTDRSILVNRAYKFYRYLMEQNQLEPLKLTAYIETIKKLKKEEKLFSLITFKISSISVLS